jgi:hypothetical protein
MFERVTARTMVLVAGSLFIGLLYFFLPNTSGVTSGTDLKRGLISTTLMVAFLVLVVWMAKGRK